ncbi:GTPase Era [Carboxydothermus hydrogenoformans]|uniref:GTPase Era n=1 Tax=Carboxydothermus hydrogenoformans (strain ATCC BAA-161 / DSM 6008 / Z-2901) TaxID=246194 RepID=ERA_CARHZ|nr:GTPase Era [Carboxydothermus hydrogenoformans]Q3AEZ3.1 RecName: Full=GTPase Era [Carboxydothermus hydrogenoformans Z-2901]ABB16149.1 GTP-binding protein Era [Carboxydothermus hydrogenoformans Z-2901]
MSYKSGFVSIVGRPNVGKSTLLNQVVGTKIAIMSDKPQTTRNKIRAVLTSEKGQIIFIDTPGVQKPRNKLGEFMLKQALTSLDEVDVLLYVVEANSPIGPQENYLLKTLAEVKTPIILVVNKIDVVKMIEAQTLARQIESRLKVAKTYYISALNGTGVSELVEGIFELLPEGPPYYPEGQVTDYPERFIIAEYIREQILHLTREEIPHSVAVVVEEIKPRENSNTVYVSAVIYVERESQKGIIIGKNGQMLKEIGQRARLEIERLLGSNIYLDLWVKVKEDWRNKDVWIRNFGFTEFE